jgi:hypothetical protein
MVLVHIVHVLVATSDTVFTKQGRLRLPKVLLFYVFARKGPQEPGTYTN